MSRIILKKSHIEEIIRHCMEEFPKEACGIIAGSGDVKKGGAAWRIYRARNVSETPESRYKMDAEELGRIFHESDDNGMDILAIYHSHTKDPASPSEYDLEKAKYQKSFYLIVSLANPKEPVIKAYSITKGRISEEELEITD